MSNDRSPVLEAQAVQESLERVRQALQLLAGHSQSPPT